MMNTRHFGQSKQRQNPIKERDWNRLAVETRREKTPKPKTKLAKRKVIQS